MSLLYPVSNISNAGLRSWSLKTGEPNSQDKFSPSAVGPTAYANPHT